LSVLFCGAAGLIMAFGSALAQEGPFSDSTGGKDVVTVSAQFAPPNSDGVSVLYLTARIAKGWHIYSITQPKGGPIATKIALEAPKEFLPAGDVRVWPKPLVKKEAAWGDLPIESHHDEVVWYMPVRIPVGTNLEALKFEGKLTVQACNEQGCLPPKPYKFVATLGKGVALPKEADPVAPLDAPKQESTQSGAGAGAEVGSIRLPGSHTTVHAQFEPRVVKPGDTATLTLTAVPDEAYHVYALEATDTGGGLYKPTLIRLTETSGWLSTVPVAEREPITKSVSIAAENSTELQRYYEGPIAWTIQVHVPQDAAPGEYPLAGVIGYQSCYAEGCDRPLGVKFQVSVRVGDATEAGAVPLELTKASYRDARLESDFAPAAPTGDKVAVAADTGEGPPGVATPADEPDGWALEFEELAIEGDREVAEMPLAWVMLFGFAGGLILNLMPCVLPVIGLKILSFVEQSHHSRARVLILNAWYALGLMSIFMILATLAAFAGFGWGELFKYSQFNIALAAVVFVMSLSFLGVWEIPIPGFAGSGRAAELAAQEGAAGAFAKGAITTILATPCTGPFLSTALLWAVAKPPAVVYAVFASIGLGMAFPYLLIGAFPRLIRWLPRPGAWMETLKNIMGFVLLGTLVYLLTILPWPSVVPTLAMLFGLWAACWWIGRHQWSTAGHSKMWAWVQGLGFAAAVGVIAFTWLQGIMAERFAKSIETRIAQAMSSEAPVAAGPSAAADHIAWKPFTLQSFRQLVSDQKTVMIDFTAPWCLTCQVLEAQVLNTQPVREVLARNGVVTMQAQWVDEYPETSLMLEKLKSEQIPVVAIFPAGKPNRPIVLRGAFRVQTLLEALDRAGPSTSRSSVAAAEMLMSVPAAR
jgi:thiol:disulfide interchange protein